MNQYQMQLNERLIKLKLVSPPEPWRLVRSIAIGGFEALGFSVDSRYLLVVSSSGRGVFDAESGNRVMKEPPSTAGEWYKLSNLTVEGIGPLAGAVIPVAGIHGGGLPLITLDGWSVDQIAPDWPNGFVTLSPAGKSPFILGKDQGVTKIAPIGGDDVIQCAGFSWSRRHLVVATSHTIDLFAR